VINEEVLQIVKRKRNILHRLKRGKSDWIGYIWRRNCFLKHVIKGKIEQTRRGGRRRQQLLDKLRKNRRYRRLTEGTLSCPLWRGRLGRGHGSFLRQISV
jgi:hypothetical protein